MSHQVDIWPHISRIIRHHIVRIIRRCKARLRIAEIIQYRRVSIFNIASRYWDREYSTPQPENCTAAHCKNYGVTVRQFGDIITLLLLRVHIAEHESYAAGNAGFFRDYEMHIRLHAMQLVAFMARYKIGPAKIYRFSRPLRGNPCKRCGRYTQQEIF